MTKITISRKTRDTYGEKNTSIAWQWCMDNLGPPVPHPRACWVWNTDRVFYFDNEKDAVLFALRWS